MKPPHRFFLLLTLAALLAPQTPASAQANTLLDAANRRRENADRTAALEAQKRLAEATARSSAESTRLAQEAVQTNPLAERAANARPPEPSLEEQARSLAGQTQLSNAFANISDEGRKALTQPILKATLIEDETPPAPAPIVVAQATPSAAPATQPGNPATPPPVTTASPGTPKPKPLKPTPVQDTKLEANKTLIFSADSFFDANRGVGVFTGNVRVYKIANGKTDLYVECDDLEVFMKKEDSNKAKNPQSAKPAASATPGSELIESNASSATLNADEKEATSSEAEESGIDKIRARGAMVIVEKYTETGDIQVGKCKDLSFDGTTQIVTLRIWPQVQRGAHLQIADEASTVMTISPEGHFKSSNGRTRTEILQGDAAKPKTKGLRRAPEQ